MSLNFPIVQRRTKSSHMWDGYYLLVHIKFLGLQCSIKASILKKYCCAFFMKLHPIASTFDNGLSWTWSFPGRTSVKKAPRWARSPATGRGWSDKDHHSLPPDWNDIIHKVYFIRKLYLVWSGVEGAFMVLSQGLQWHLDLLPDLRDGGEGVGHLAVVPHPLVHRLHLVRHHVRPLALLKGVSAQHPFTHLNIPL